MQARLIPREMVSGSSRSSGNSRIIFINWRWEREENGGGDGDRWEKECGEGEVKIGEGERRGVKGRRGGEIKKECKTHKKCLKQVYTVYMYVEY